MSSHSEQPIAATIVITVIEPGPVSIQGSPSKCIRLTEADVAALKTAHPGLTVLGWAKASLEVELEAAYDNRSSSHFGDKLDAPEHFASEHTPEDHFNRSNQ